MQEECFLILEKCMHIERLAKQAVRQKFVSKEYFYLLLHSSLNKDKMVSSFNSVSKNSSSEFELLIKPAPAKAFIILSLNRADRIETANSQPPLKSIKPIKPEYNPRSCFSNFRIKCIAFSFGTPQTAGVGNKESINSRVLVLMFNSAEILVIKCWILSSFLICFSSMIFTLSEY